MRRWQSNPVRRQKPRTLIAVVVTLLAALTYAFADVSVTFDVQPRTIKVGDSAVCTFTIRGANNPSTPSLPQIDGLQFSGPAVQRNFSMVNGKIDNYVSYQYQVVPIRNGSFSIGPFKYQAGNQVLDLPSITLQALSRSADASQSGQQQGQDWLFARLSASKTNVINQESFEILISVYIAQGLSIGREISLANMPDAGLTIQNFHEISGVREAVNNKAYEVKRFRANARALTEGTFVLEPVIRASLRVPRNSRSRPRSMFDDSFFDSFFGRTEAQPVDLHVKPVNITVAAVPGEGKPESFSGAVGLFTFDVDVKPTELTVGDPVTMTARIAGQGNIDSLSAPLLKADDHFKLYESRLVSKNINEAGTAGEKIFEQVLIPRSEDAATVPPLEFSFFDPEKKAYQVIRRGPFTLALKPAENGTARIVQSTTERAGPTRILGTDIVYLKPPPSAWNDTLKSAVYTRSSFWIVQAIPLLGVALVYVTSLRKRQLQTDVAFARRQRAPKAARAGLRKAETALRETNAAEFYEAMWDALSSYFGNRLNLAPGEVTDRSILDAVEHSGMEMSDISILKSLFSECDERRFAGRTGADKDTMSKDLRETQRVLRICERLKI
ncbi:MAG: BatD family protein [Verrucomicrobia bacterium]|nr:BatD family protein [Verrucomicrobiota bacterium]